MKCLILNNGVSIPQIGYGVYQIPKEITKQCVLDALEVGYQHIDTAFMYGNEKEVGEAIRESNIPREDIFVTTKIVRAKNYDDACRMIELALKTLDIGYIDLMLIHWPEGDSVATYKAMEKYYKEGKLKAIGLSNFYGKELDSILSNSTITPVLNQIEAHVFRNQKEEQKKLESLDILLEAWSPLAAGKDELFKNETLNKIGKKYHKTAAQVALRFLIEKGMIILPRTKNKDRMKENLDILDFTLDVDDISTIEKLDKNKSIFEW